MKKAILTLATVAAMTLDVAAQEVIRCGEGSYASYAPWRLARSTRHWGDQSRIMQTRPIYMTERRKGDPIPTSSAARRITSDCRRKSLSLSGGL